MAGLTDAKIAKLKPTESPYKRAIGKGLSILVTPAGGKLWRFRWRANGVERMQSLGSFPEITVDEACKRRDAAREAVAHDVDPAAVRRAEKLATANTFEAVATGYRETPSEPLRGHDRARRMDA